MKTPFLKCVPLSVIFFSFRIQFLTSFHCQLVVFLQRLAQDIFMRDGIHVVSVHAQQLSSDLTGLQTIYI